MSNLLQELPCTSSCKYLWLAKDSENKRITRTVSKDIPENILQKDLGTSRQYTRLNIWTCSRNDDSKSYFRYKLPKNGQ